MSPDRSGRPGPKYLKESNDLLERPDRTERERRDASAEEDDLVLGGGGVRLVGYQADPGRRGPTSFVVRYVRLPLARVLELGLGPGPGHLDGVVDARRAGLVKVAPDTWLARRRGPLIGWLTNEIALPEGMLQVAEKLIVTDDALYLLGFDGPPRRIDRAEACERFADATVGPLDSAPERFWPPPLPLIAVVVQDNPHDERVPEAAFTPLLRRPCYTLPSHHATFRLDDLEGVPVVSSHALLQHLVLKTSDGIFHPDRAPITKVPHHRNMPRLVFGHPDPSWASLAQLARRS